MHPTLMNHRLKEEFTRMRERLPMNAQLQTTPTGELSMRVVPSLSLSPSDSSAALLKLPSFLHQEHPILDVPFRSDGGLVHDRVTNPLVLLRMPLAHHAEATVFKTVADSQGNAIDFAKRALFS